ncbi:MULTISPECIES: hypothetical protein [Paenibacillus]|uniref:hypothetical protein n=1 Tax=Paenibacillus TaxID=44249 RepID=UPI0022B8E80F|nr:hypothetical protein [Paenibacillus caseinilyticus]MCZ8520168.1 hypothetical protein [Paenibacillus caseinilyticus]
MNAYKPWCGTYLLEGNMGGQYHDFFLIPNTTDLEDYQNFKNNSIESAVIHDDLINYINDSLVWIPSKNPCEGGIPNVRGLNNFGLTLFDKQSSEVLILIFRSWRDLFKNAPDILELTVYGEDKLSDSKEKLVLVFNRDEVIKQFDMVILMSERLSEGDFYLLHCGI